MVYLDNHFATSRNFDGDRSLVELLGIDLGVGKHVLDKPCRRLGFLVAAVSVAAKRDVEFRCGAATQADNRGAQVASASRLTRGKQVASASRLTRGKSANREEAKQHFCRLGEMNARGTVPCNYPATWLRNDVGYMSLVGFSFSTLCAWRRARDDNRTGRT